MKHIYIKKKLNLKYVAAFDFVSREVGSLRSRKPV